MADSFDRYDNDAQGNGFMMGLLTGAVLGAGLGMLLAPKAGTELRGSLGEQARNLGNMASEQYKRASETASGWADRGREFVDKARESTGGTTGSSYSTGQGSGQSGSTGSGSTGSGSTGSTYGTGNSGSTFGSTGASGSDFGRS
jgi:gas vesicle protein